MNINANTDAKKGTTKSKRLIFLTTRKPQSIVSTARRQSPPTYHEAVCPVKKYNRTKPIAAGLNICLLYLIKINFDEIARKETKMAEPKKAIVRELLGGAKMRKTMSAVI